MDDVNRNYLFYSLSSEIRYDSPPQAITVGTVLLSTARGLCNSSTYLTGATIVIIVTSNVLLSSLIGLLLFCVRLNMSWLQVMHMLWLKSTSTDICGNPNPGKVKF